METNTSPVSWIRFDAINTITGGTSGPAGHLELSGEATPMSSGSAQSAPLSFGRLASPVFHLRLYGIFMLQSMSSAGAILIRKRSVCLAAPVTSHTGQRDNPCYIFIYVDGSACAG